MADVKKDEFTSRIEQARAELDRLSESINKLKTLGVNTVNLEGTYSFLKDTIDNLEKSRR